MQDIHINVLTRAELGNSTIASDVVRAIVATHEDFIPRRFGGYEPLPHKVNGPFSIEQFLQGWRSPWWWSNGRRATGGYWFGDPKMHSAVKASVTCSRVSPELAARLATTLALQLDSDLSTVYYAYESDPQYLFRYKAVCPFYFGPNTHDLKLSLPDLPWFTVFGKPYVELFGRKKLKTVPAFRSAAVAEKKWIVQLTKDPRNAKKDADAYDHIRDSAKAHLGPEYFLDLASPAAQRRTPDFRWSPTVHNPLEEFLRAKNLLADEPTPN